MTAQSVSQAKNLTCPSISHTKPCASQWERRTRHALPTHVTITLSSSPAPALPPSPGDCFLSPPHWSVVIHAGFSRPIFNVAINTLYFPLMVLLLIYKSEYFTFLNQDQSFPSIFTSGSEATVTQRLVIAGFQARESQFSGRVENGTNTRTEMMTKRTVPERFQTLGSSYS